MKGADPNGQLFQLERRRFLAIGFAIGIFERWRHICGDGVSVVSILPSDLAAASRRE
jgi:hypothetical protein